VSRWPIDAIAARRRRARHAVYLQADGVASWLTSNPAGQAEAFPAFEDWCAAHRGAEATVFLAGERAWGLVAPPSLGLHQIGAVEAWARAQFAHYHGPQATTWPLAAWLEGGHGGACAAPGLDLARLRAEARRHGVRLRAVMPAWRAGLDALAAAWPAIAGPGRRALLLLEDVTATWLVVQDGALAGLEQRFLDAGRADAVDRLLADFAQEEPALDEPPALAGWHPAAPAAAPAHRRIGDPSGAAALGRWLRGDLAQAAR
jgi:hypothetical protein